MQRSDLSQTAGSIRAAAEILSFAGEAPAPAERMVPVEAAVNIIYANLPFAVMMMTPDDFEDFAVGFSLTEGIIERLADVREIRVEREERGFRLVVDLARTSLHAHLARRRALSGRTGCGVCGIDDLASLPSARKHEGATQTVTVEAIRTALAALEERQALNRLTRAVHAAAFADMRGSIIAVREDVGRHNALDKLIGALLRTQIEPQAGFFIVTSRCSFEMVEKVAAFGGRTIVAISAPTSLALERARHHDIMLIGVARRDSMTVFHGLERIVREIAPA